jgi:biotin transport system substrate-specific component
MVDNQLKKIYDVIELKMEVEKMKTNKTSRMIKIALMAALIGILSYISIPIPPVPITAQTIAVMLAGLLLTPMDAMLSLLIFILLGAIGVPVFSNGSSGLGVLFGPTGGYIFGFLISAGFISYFKGTGKNIYRNLIVTTIGGIFVVYLIGIPWLAISYDMTLINAIKAGALPFLIGDLLKVILASFIGKKINQAL